MTQNINKYKVIGAEFKISKQGFSNLLIKSKSKVKLDNLFAVVLYSAIEKVSQTLSPQPALIYITGVAGRARLAMTLRDLCCKLWTVHQRFSN